MSKRGGKTKSPTDPAEWREWAREQLDGMQAEVDRIAELVGSTCDAIELADKDHDIDLEQLEKDLDEKRYPGGWVRTHSLKHWTGMLERVENSLQLNISACAERRAQAKTAARGDVDSGKLVRVSSHIADLHAPTTYAFAVKTGVWEEVLKDYLKRGLNKSSRSRLYDLYGTWYWGEPEVVEYDYSKVGQGLRAGSYSKTYTGKAAWARMSKKEAAIRRARERYGLIQEECRNYDASPAWESVELADEVYSGLAFHVLDRQANMLLVTSGEHLLVVRADAMETVEEERK